jgi:hypothetical protein
MSVTPPTITATNAGAVSLTLAPSRSLSGAPYLTTGTSTWAYSITASNMFDPAFYAGEIFTQANSTTATGSWTIASNTVSCDGNGVATTGKVYDQAGNLKNSGFPNYNDVIRSTATITQTIIAATKNINQIGIGTTIATLSTTAKGYNNSTQPIDSSRVIYYHESGSYGQPISSGSLGIYGRAQGYDESTLTGTTENFTGENNRLKIDNAALTGSYQNGTKFTTGSYDAYNLGALDLQVKPGYLVRPGGSYKYWLADPDSTKSYKFYARSFRVTGAYSSLYINIGKTLNNWTSTSDGASVAILFNSVFANGNLSGTFGNSNPVLFDVASILSTGIEANNQAPDNFINPFSTNINVYGNVGGTISGTKYGIGLDSGTLKQILNPNFQPVGYVDFVVLVRYKGDVVPVTAITQSNS